MTIPHFSGIFSAHSSAIKHSNPDAYNQMIETTQAEGIPARISALKSDLKLKKQSSDPALTDEYISYVPPIQRHGGGAYKLKFAHPRGEQQPDAFIRDSLTRVEQLEALLLADNLVAQKDNGIVHSRYISPKFIKHANGSIDKYVAAKHAFATNVNLPALPDSVSVKMLDNGSIRIQIKGPHFYSRKLHNENVALPANLLGQAEGEEAIGLQRAEITTFVNEQIRRAKNLATGHGLSRKPPQEEHVVDEDAHNI